MINLCTQLSILLRRLLLKNTPFLTVRRHRLVTWRELPPACISGLNLPHHVFEAFLTDIKFSIYPRQWHQVVEPFAFWHLVYEGGTFWICLDYRSFWVIQKYNSHFSVNTVAALKAFLLHLPIFTSFAHESQQKHKTNAVCFSTFHTIFGCVLIWALMWKR